MKFEKVNENPKNRKTGDCVIRAIATATNKTRMETYKSLCSVGEELADLPNCSATYEKYLFSLGYEKHKMPVKSSGKRFTIEEYFDKFKYKHPVIVTVASHMTCVEDNILKDRWDCSSKSICVFYTKIDDELEIRVGK